MRFLNALSFLTIIKIPERSYTRKQSYPKALVYFPVVGLLLGLFNSIVFFSFNFIFPLILTIILMSGLEILLTGGIHIDGIADTFDGVFSGEKDRKRILEIMKRGDVGVFGVLAIVFSIGLKVAFFYFIALQLNVLPLSGLDSGTSGTGAISAGSSALMSNMKSSLPGFLLLLIIIVFTPVYGRLSMLYLFSRYEPVGGAQSLTYAFKDKGNRDVFILSAIYFSIVLIAVSVISRLWFMKTNFDLSLEILAVIYAVQSVLIILLTMLISSGAGRFFTARAGGLNGDIIGAVCVVTEVSFLFLNYISIVFL